MAFNFEKLKKIPIFKNVDFEDPRSRKRVGLAFAAAALVLILVILNMLSGNKDVPSAAEKAKDNTFLEVPEGVDRDILNEDDMVAARMRRTPGNKDIFAESSAFGQEDPLSFLNEEERLLTGDVTTGISSEQEPQQNSVTGQMFSDRASRKSRAMDLFGLSSDDGHRTPETDAVVEPAQAQPAPKEAPAAPKAEPAPKPKKTTPKPKVQPSQATAKAEPEPTPQNDDPAAAQQGQGDAPRQPGVRRSGSISSLDGDWGGIEGISSLDNESQYVNEDQDHPYKVMFTRDQKIKSGDRITIRLLEDMAVNGILIPRNTHLSATCNLGERLEIKVSNIEINGKIYALNYIAFDNDGSQGLYCPNTEGNKSSRQAKSAASSAASSALGTAATLIGTAMGSGAIGGMLGSMTNVGAQAVTGHGGAVSAEVNSGYVFYLLKEL